MTRREKMLSLESRQQGKEIDDRQRKWDEMDSSLGNQGTVIQERNRHTRKHSEWNERKTRWQGEAGKDGWRGKSIERRDWPGESVSRISMQSHQNERQRHWMKVRLSVEKEDDQEKWTVSAHNIIITPVICVVCFDYFNSVSVVCDLFSRFLPFIIVSFSNYFCLLFQLTKSLSNRLCSFFSQTIDRALRPSFLRPNWATIIHNLYSNQRGPSNNYFVGKGWSPFGWQGVFSSRIENPSLGWLLFNSVVFICSSWSPRKLHLSGSQRCGARRPLRIHGHLW